MAEFVEYLNLLARSEILIGLVAGEGVPFLIEIFTPPLQVQFQVERPVILTVVDNNNRQQTLYMMKVMLNVVM